MLGWLRNKMTTRQAPPAEQQLAAIQGIGDFLTPLSYKESESYLPAVIGCIDFISRSICVLPISVYRYEGTKKEIVRDGAVAELLADPHPQLTMPEILLMSMIDLLAFGNFIIIQRMEGDRLTLTPIPWSHVTAPYRDYNAAYRVNYPDGKTQVIPNSQVIHVRIGCIDGGFIGRSPLARNSRTIALNKLVEKATAGLWTNGVYPSIALKTTKSFKPEQREEARKSLITQLSGDNRGKPMFLDQDFNIEQVTANSKDLQHIEQRLYGVVQICQIFGVSPILAAQDYRFGTYSNYSQAWRAWALDGMAIYQKLISKVLTKKLLPNEQDLSIELDSSHLLQDRESKVTEIIQLVQSGILTTEDGKRELGYG